MGAFLAKSHELYIQEHWVYVLAGLLGVAALARLAATKAVHRLSPRALAFLRWLANMCLAAAAVTTVGLVVTAARRAAVQSTGAPAAPGTAVPGTAVPGTAMPLATRHNLFLYFAGVSVVVAFLFGATIGSTRNGILSNKGKIRMTAWFAAVSGLLFLGLVVACLVQGDMSINTLLEALSLPFLQSIVFIISFAFAGKLVAAREEKLRAGGTGTEMQPWEEKARAGGRADRFVKLVPALPFFLQPFSKLFNALSVLPVLVENGGAYGDRPDWVGGNSYGSSDTETVDDLDDLFEESETEVLRKKIEVVNLYFDPETTAFRKIGLMREIAQDQQLLALFQNQGATAESVVYQLKKTDNSNWAHQARNDLLIELEGQKREQKGGNEAFNYTFHDLLNRVLKNYGRELNKPTKAAVIKALGEFQEYGKFPAKGDVVSRVAWFKSGLDPDLQNWQITDTSSLFPPNFTKRATEANELLRRAKAAKSSLLGYLGFNGAVLNEAIESIAEAEKAHEPKRQQSAYDAQGKLRDIMFSALEKK
jgi:hypothetical protein